MRSSAFCLSLKPQLKNNGYVLQLIISQLIKPLGQGIVYHSIKARKPTPTREKFKFLHVGLGTPLIKRKFESTHKGGVKIMVK